MQPTENQSRMKNRQQFIVKPPESAALNVHPSHSTSKDMKVFKCTSFSQYFQGHESFLLYFVADELFPRQPSWVRGPQGLRGGATRALPKCASSPQSHPPDHAPADTASLL